MDEPTLEPAAHEGTAKDRLREQERRHAFLLMLGDRLRGRSDPVAIMEAASEALGRHLAVYSDSLKIRASPCQTARAGFYRSDDTARLPG
jgi:hypothetical protein